VTISQALSTSSASAAILGRIEPRLWTPPLRELTPDTSYGFDLIDFAAAIGWPLDEWQQWLAIHMGELLPDGRPRFRMVLALVARQNGKTVLCRVLTLYWMFVDQVPLILGTSTSRDTAKESWRKTIEMAEGIDLLAGEMAPLHTRETIGEEAFFNLAGSRYRFAAPNNRAGRSMTVYRLILDELREHKTWDTYNAAYKAMTAVYDGQAVAITNQGDANAVVLDSLRDMALEYIELGSGDPRLGLFEWSAPNGCDPTDPHALAMANPSLNRRGIFLDSMIGEAMRAKRAGGLELASFRTETLCQRVTVLDAAIDEEAWDNAGTDSPVDLAEHRQRTALCFDVAPDGSHATLVAAATVDGTTHVEVVKTWIGYGCTKQLRADLPGIVERIKPRTLAWFPGGPAAFVAADLVKRRNGKPVFSRRVVVEELKAETPAVCMGLAEQVLSGEIQHPKDDMLTGQVKATQKLMQGDRWVFTRRGTTPVDGTYATAGAVHAARTLPAPLPALTVA
jgi:phage terminase large subunit-like protein